ncbi:MAG TPA: hypothetical protein VE620_10215 [Myxococcales bacterium]|nr:hypothetical protein [Myxococcales bacterium]
MRRPMMRSRPVQPVVCSIDMGYGHVRAAAPLADALGVPMLRMDLPPLGGSVDSRLWWRTRALYEPLTRWSQSGAVAAPLRAVLARITAIPDGAEDSSGPGAGTRWMERAARRGAGRALAAHLRRTGAPLLSTFYAAPILAELHGADRLHCVVTDADVNRIWAPPDPSRSRIRYFVPAELTRRRLESYGVPPELIRVTGFPLPDELVGGRQLEALQSNLAARLARLDRRGVLRGVSAELRRAIEKRVPPLVTFAIGGAGAQAGLAADLVRALADSLRKGRLRLALVAGRRRDVSRKLRRAIAAANLAGSPALELLEERDTLVYLRSFNALLARTDVLWTKPSELTFFAALGLPLVAAPPVGGHEERNLRWAVDLGAALPQGEPRRAAEWLLQWVEDGTLARAAWQGYREMPKVGLYDILDQFEAAA